MFTIFLRRVRAAHPLGLLLTAALSASIGTAVPATSSGAAGSTMKFVAMQMDVELEGAFKDFAAAVDFDPAHLDRCKVDITVDLASVDTGSVDGDTLLKGKGFFDVVHFPRASFVSANIKAIGPNKFLANGDFALKGHSARLAVPFATRVDADGTWVEGHVPVSRLAYGVGQGEWTDTGTLSDEVQVKFKLLLPKRGAAPSMR